MPGVQCVICLSSDTSTDEWCALRECGHVFHTHCLVQSLEHNRRCPQCRMDYGGRKWGGGKQPYQRIFFEFSDEPLSQPQPGGGGGGGGSGGADPAQVAFLQGQVRDKERRLQTMHTQLVEAEDKAAQLQADLGLARSALRDKEAKLQEKIGELSREHKQVKSLTNQVANLSSQLKTQAGHGALLNLTTDHTLMGPALGAEVRKLVQLGMKAPNDFWDKLVSDRNSIIASNNNRHAKERAALERQQEKLQAEVARLQAEVAGLKRSLAAARQGQPGGAAAMADAAFEAAQQRAPVGPRHAVRRFGGGGAGTSAAGPSSAAAAAEDDDPLLQSYDLLDSMRVADLPAAKPRQAASQQQAQQTQQTQQQVGPRQQDHQPAAGAADAAAAAAGSEDEDEIVLLDGSEEQWQEGDAAGWAGEEEEEAEVCLSEEDEPDAQPQPQQRRPQQTAAPPPPMQQQQQHSQRSKAGGSLLGKRPGAAALGADENCPGGSGSAGAALLPLAAGPARAALHRGPGTTFIRNTSAASLGIDRGRYISSGPDGKGGVATAYQSGKSGGGGAVRLAQRQLDLPALQQAGGAKKARSGSGSGSGSQSSMGSADAAAAAALRRNNALPITSFFSKAPSSSRQ